MKNVRFFLEHETPQDKRKGRHSGNVFAAFVDPNADYQGGFLTTINDKLAVCYEGMGSLYGHANSDVCGASASREFLAENCKRISEAQARLIHPNLFARLGD